MVLATLPTVSDLSVRSALTRLSAGSRTSDSARSAWWSAPAARLRGSPESALPELVERLARQRLRAPAL